MELIFLNSMDKETETGEWCSAQVSISEERGIWYVQWLEPDSEERFQTTSWYEGVHWEEALRAFRLELAHKIGEGFIPKIGDYTDDTEDFQGKAKQQQLLYYYSDVNVDPALYDSLRIWRRTKVNEEKRAPYLVATNKLLQLISCFKPQTHEELLQLPGFGEAKVTRYGDEITQFTAGLTRTTAFPLDWVETTIDSYRFRRWMFQQKEQKRQRELDSQADKRKLLEGIVTGHSLDELQQGISRSRRELVSWVENLDREGYDIDLLIDLELEKVPDSEKELAWKAFEKEGDRFLKPAMKAVYGDTEAEDKTVEKTYEWLRLLRLRFRKIKGMEQAMSEAG